MSNVGILSPSAKSDQSENESFERHAKAQITLVLCGIEFTYVKTFKHAATVGFDNALTIF